MLVFLLISWGLSEAITSEYVFKWFRKLIHKTKIKWLKKLFGCPNCLSFYVGVGLYFLMPLTALVSIYLDPILYGLISFATVKLLNIFLSDKYFKIDDGFDDKKSS